LGNVMSLTEQELKALRDKASLLLMIETKQGKEQDMADIIREAANQCGATVIIAAKIDKVDTQPESTGK